MTAEVSVSEVGQALGCTRRWIRGRARRERWPFREASCRGGRRRLYRVEDLPGDVRSALESPGKAALNGHLPAVEDASPDANPPDSAAWDALPAAARDRIRKRFAVLDEALSLAERETLSMAQALARAAESQDSPWSARTLLHDWHGRRGRPGLKGLPRASWGPALARRSGSGRRFAAIPEEAWNLFKADYLRPEQPPAAMCHRTLSRIAAARGWTIPGPRALLRRLRAEVSPRAIVLARQGPEALARMRPAQQRDRTALRVMECLCADGHVFDARVDFGRGIEGRAVLVAWQDVCAGEIAGWRLGRSETTDAYRLSLSDVLWKYGAPESVIVDNGRGIAARAFAGGSGAYRGRDTSASPIGLLTQLIGKENIHWTTPYSGQSKPIERAFRDLAVDIAKDPRLAGAYTGRNTLSKPHNYGQRSIPIDEFRAVVADMIEQHNARPGRQGMGMEGRSFDEVFRAGLQEHAPRRVSESELARWLLSADMATARKSDGAVLLHGNRYWDSGLADALAGRPPDARKVVVRYDPERLDRPVLVEDREGRLIARAEVMGATRFFDKAAAKETAKAKARLLKATRQELELHAQLGVGAVADALQDAAASEAEADPAPASPQVEEILDNVLQYGGGEEEEPHPDPDRAAEEEMVRQSEERLLQMAGLA